MATPRNRYRIASAYSTHPPWLEIQSASLSLAQLVEARSRRPCFCLFKKFAEDSGDVRKPDSRGNGERGNGAFVPESPRTSAPTVPRPSAGASAASARRLATTTRAVCLCVRRDGGEVQRRSETEERPRRRVVATVRPRERVKRRSRRCREWGRLAGQLGIVDGDFRRLPRYVYTPPAYLFFARASRRARMRRRSAPVANRLIARRSQNRRALFPTESRRGSRTRDGRLTHASSGARDAPRAARAVRHAERTSLTGAPNAREWKCRGRECPKRHVLVFWFLGCRDTNRRARPKKARPKRRARHNGTAPAGGSGGER